jgi:hypothetical protein
MSPQSRENLDYPIYVTAESEIAVMEQREFLGLGGLRVTVITKKGPVKADGQTLQTEVHRSPAAHGRSLRVEDAQKISNNSLFSLLFLGKVFTLEPVDLFVVLFPIEIPLCVIRLFLISFFYSLNYTTHDTPPE